MEKLSRITWRPKVITCIFVRGVRRVRVRDQRWEDALLLTLKIQEGARSQGGQAAFKSREVQGNTFFLGASRKHAVLLIS